MKKFLFLTSFLFIIPSFSIATAASPDEKVVDHLLSTSVTVSAPDGTGSGAVILRGDRAYILTAAHVVAACKKTTTLPLFSLTSTSWSELKVYQERLEEGDRVVRIEWICEIVRYNNADDGEDLAVLLVKKKSPPGLKTSTNFYLDKKIPRIGLDLFHVGSPTGDGGSNSFIPATLSAHGRKLYGKNYDQITCPTTFGSSGGLVALSDGRYIGMLQRKYPDSGQCLIKPIREIRKWGSKVGVEFLFDPTKPESDLRSKPIEDN